MNIDYVTADTHFGHQNILLYKPSRITKLQEARFEDFDEMIIDMWNRSVKKEDNILHLGDVWFKDG